VLSPKLLLDFSQHVRFLRYFSIHLPKHWKCSYWVALESDNKIFPKTKIYVVFLILGLVFKTFLESFYHLWFVSNLYSIRNVWKLPSPISWLALITFSEELNNIILEEKLAKKLKNSHENFSCVKVTIILGLFAWSSEIYMEVLREINFSCPLLNFLAHF
jgi:hypothetical protein